MAKAPEGFYILTDTTITIEGLKDPLGAAVLDANVSAVLKDRNGNVVEGGENIPFVFKEGSNGDYIGNLPPISAMRQGYEYDLVVTCERDNRRMTLIVRRSAGFLYA